MGSVSASLLMASRSDRIRNRRRSTTMAGCCLLARTPLFSLRAFDSSLFARRYTPLECGPSLFKRVPRTSVRERTRATPDARRSRRRRYPRYIGARNFSARDGASRHRSRKNRWNFRRDDRPVERLRFSQLAWPNECVGECVHRSRCGNPRFVSDSHAAVGVDRVRDYAIAFYRDPTRLCRRADRRRRR